MKIVRFDTDVLMTTGKASGCGLLENVRKGSGRGLLKSRQINNSDESAG